jgi:hypothetical protein
MDYDKHSGICSCHKIRFSIQGAGYISILDRENPSKYWNKVHHPESQSNEVPIGTVNKSRYCLVTEEKFCCIYFKSK